MHLVKFNSTGVAGVCARVSVSEPPKPGLPCCIKLLIPVISKNKAQTRGTDLSEPQLTEGGADLRPVAVENCGNRLRAFSRILMFVPGRAHREKKFLYVEVSEKLTPLFLL